jgi:hypothetical protein
MEPTPEQLAQIKKLWEDAVVVCATIAFSLPADGPTIEQLQTEIPALSIIAHVGSSYAVSIPANHPGVEQCMKFPDPLPEDLANLEQETNDKLNKGFWS